MKNKMVDVRNHLVGMLEELGSNEATEQTIERAKAMSQVAGQYISAVRTEIDALRLADDIGRLPVAVSVDDTVLVSPPKPALRVLSNR